MAERTVDIDEVLNHIGGFGPYQRKIYFFLCIPILFVGAQSLSYVFIAAKPDYRYEITYFLLFILFVILYFTNSC